MTGPVTTEALREALNAAIELQRCLAPLDQIHWSAEDPSVCLRLFRETETRAVIDLMKAVRGFEDTASLAPLLAALQQVTAERDEEKARADRNDAKLAEITQPWVDDKGGVWLAPTAWAYAKACGALHQHRDRANVAEASLATATSELARLRAALKVFADMDAMDPPEGVPLNEWLPAVTGARAALREPPALARAATAREGDTPTTEDKGREDRA